MAIRLGARPGGSTLDLKNAGAALFEADLVHLSLERSSCWPPASSATRQANRATTQLSTPVFYSWLQRAYLESANAIHENGK